MKRLIFIFAVLFSVSGYAQLKTPTSDTWSYFSQLWNTTSVYYNVVTAPSQLGAQIDTIANTASVSLKSSNFFIGSNGNPAIYTLPGSSKGISAIVNADTIVVAPIPGWGQVTLTAAVTRATYTGTITPTYTQTAISSSDGLVWAPIPGATVYTVTPTSSLTVPTVSKWIFTTKPDRYLGVTTAGLQTNCSASTQAWVYFLKPYVFGN